MKIIGYAEFVEMCRVTDTQNWHGMAVKEDGVWIQLPPNHPLITLKERAALSAHPKNNLTTPALEFPCTCKKLRTFLEWAEEGMADRYLGIEVSEIAKGGKKGGKPKGSLYEAVEFAYMHFWNEGNTEILRQGKINEFIDRLCELSDEENKDISDYIAERIEITKSRSGSFKITTKERVIKEGKEHVITNKRRDYSKKDVSKIMSALRQIHPLSI